MNFILLVCFRAGGSSPAFGVKLTLVMSSLVYFTKVNDIKGKVSVKRRAGLVCSLNSLNGERINGRTKKRLLIIRVPNMVTHLRSLCWNSTKI